MAGAGVENEPLLDGRADGGERFKGEMPFCVGGSDGGSVGVLISDPAGCVCLNCGVVRTEGVAPLLGGRPCVEKDVDGDERTVGELSRGCFTGDSILEETGGKALSGGKVPDSDFSGCDEPLTLGETWKMPLGGRILCSPV
jgi:hypothetical protein